jgi:hypothetical protein
MLRKPPEIRNLRGSNPDGDLGILLAIHELQGAAGRGGQLGNGIAALVVEFEV